MCTAIRRGGLPLQVEISSRIYTNEKNKLRTCITMRDITERLRAEEELRRLNEELERRVIERTQTLDESLQALRQSEERFRQFVEGTDDLITQVDVKGRFLYVSPSARRIFGLDPDQCLGRFAFDFVHPEDCELTMTTFERWLNEKVRHAVYQNRLVGSKGQVHHMRWTINIHYDQEGQLAWINSIAKDITDQVLIEESLRRSEERYRRIFETAHEGIVGLDTEHHIKFANQSLANMLGFQPEELLGCSYYDLAAHEDQEDIQRQYRLRLEGQSDTFEQRLLKKDGSSLWVRISANPLQDNEGRLVGSFSMISDISHHKAAERQAELNRARLDILWGISQYQPKDLQDLLDLALNEGLKLTGSKLGYVYLYDEPNRRFTLNSYSRRVVDACEIRQPKTQYDLDHTGIWGEVVRQERPIMINDFQAPHKLKRGYPEGHAHLANFLTIPVFAEGRVVAVVGMANKDQGYDDLDVTQLQLMMESVWRIAERLRVAKELKLAKE